MRNTWTVYLKELVDALRDRRTLTMALLGSVAMGPLMLVLLSFLISSIEERADARELVAVGMKNAPTLENYLLRQSYTIKEAPADYEQRLAAGKQGDPVLVVPAKFEAELAQAEAPTVELVSSSADRRAEAAVRRVLALLQGFDREQGVLRLAMRGVAPGLLQSVRVEQRDLADPAARAAQFTSMVPFFVVMAVLYGALGAALDTTAGERERGSLEPLLTNPAERASLVIGKWGAVASVAVLISVASAFSFVPGQWMVRSESLQAMFQFGPAEALAFVALLLPLAAALSAVLMAVAIRCKTFKEAQASATLVVMAVSLLPMVTVFSQEGEQPWHLWAPGLAQATLMGRVLKAETLGAWQVLPSAAVCAVVAVLALGYVARSLERAALE